MADKAFKGKITAKGTEIAVLSKGTPDDYISLTDIAKYKNAGEPFIVINNWMRVRNTIEYLGIWEQLNNDDFYPIEFDRFLHEAGANAFTLSPTKFLVLANLENVNSLYINNGMPQSERIEELNCLARSQMAAILSNSSLKGLKAFEGRTVLDDKR